MPPSTRRLSAGCLVILPLLILAPGCGRKAPAPAVVAQHVSREPGEIELSDPKATLLEPDIVQFEVRYRFTKGQPDKYYSCDITFPGTPNRGIKTMDSWQLKPEGVIRDRVQLSKPGVKSFEITMSETTSPQLGYKKISNVVKGTVQ